MCAASPAPAAADNVAGHGAAHCASVPPAPPPGTGTDGDGDGSGDDGDDAAPPHANSI